MGCFYDTSNNTVSHMGATGGVTVTRKGVEGVVMTLYGI